MSKKLDAGALLAKAERAFLSARALLDLEDVDGACNRAYYAMFDAARAALIVSDVVVQPDVARTHSGLITAFSLHLVKNGPLPREVGRMLKRAEEIRLVADYKDNSVWPEDAAEMVRQAESFISAVRALMMVVGEKDADQASR